VSRATATAVAGFTAALALLSGAPDASALPDVIVVSTSVVPASPAVGQATTFSCVVRNQGPDATPSGVSVGVGYRIDGVQKTWGAVSGPLAAGASVTITTQGGAWSATSGAHTLTAMVDDINRFAETNESNNVSAPLSFTVGSSSAGPTGDPTVLSNGALQWEAENYTGGTSAASGVDYYDTSAGNYGGKYRTQNVDIESCSEGGYNVGWTAAGEWMRYRFTGGGTYQISVRYAAYYNSTVHIEVDGVNVSGAIALPATGGWQNWATVTGKTITLASASHTVRFIADSAGFNVNYFRFTPATAPPPPPGQPDVVVTSVSLSPSAPAVGQAVTFTAVVKNIGTGPTPSGVSIGVGYRVDGTQKTWGAVAGPLAAGASVTIGTQGGAWSATSGTHSLTAMVDDINRFAESNESNNVSAAVSFSVGSTTPPPPPPTTVTSRFGINIDPANPAGNPSIQALKAAGVRWVRLEWKVTHGAAYYDPLIASYRAAGLKVLVILDYSSISGRVASSASDADWLNYITRFSQFCRDTASRLGNNVDAWQIWNEQDHLPKPGYDPYVRPNLYGRLLRDSYNAIKAYSARPVVTGGSASGSPTHLQQARDAVGGLYADAVAIHPYGKRAPDNWPWADWGFGNMSESINVFYNAFGKPIWMTEIGLDTQNNDWNFEAQYLQNVYDLTGSDSFKNKVPVVFWFCWSDGMVADFGILQANAAPKPAYYRYQSIAGSW
jgi:hypothetical protein